MAHGNGTQQAASIDHRSIVALPAVGRPFLYKCPQPLQIEHLGGRWTGGNAIELPCDPITHRRQPFVPVGSLHASSRLIEHDPRQPIRKCKPR